MMNQDGNADCNVLTVYETVLHHCPLNIIIIARLYGPFRCQVTEVFEADKYKKVILGVGADSDEQGMPCFLPSVEETERQVVDKEDAWFHYVFCQIRPLRSAVNNNKRIFIKKSISETGVINIGSELLFRRFPPTDTDLKK
ncbi:hypothetical protein B9Z55_027305 [Caenorhabditis nigoni]|nr:hypothetical protein B9Z55_027305 [Caenorhabditis nigoni]